MSSKWDHQARLHAAGKGKPRHSPADIQHQGRVAFLTGAEQVDCPYPSGTHDERAWLAGFLAEYQAYYFNQKKDPDGIGA